MVPGVAGSNPVIRPSYKNTGVSAGIFITPVGSGFEPAKKPFEPPQKGGRKYAGCAHAQFCKVMKHSEIIRLSAPEIKNRPTGDFLFLCKDTDSNRRFAYSVPVIAKGYANVENVGVRLWQSSAICLRAFARTSLSFPRPGPPQIRMCLWGGQGGNLISFQQ